MTASPRGRWSASVPLFAAGAGAAGSAGAAGLVLVALLSSCGSDQEPSVTRAAPPPPPVASSEVITGAGGRAQGDRSWSDPLRYAYYGLPRRDDLQPAPVVLYNDGYVVGYDMARHQPLWTCYRLFAQAKGRLTEERQEAPASPTTDPRLVPAAPPAPAEGRREREIPPWLALVPTGPLAACYGAHAGSEAYLSSACLTMSAPPGWYQLLGLEPGYAQAHQELWVMTGPLPGNGSDSGSDGLWKIQIFVHSGVTELQAFILPPPPPGDERRQHDHPVDVASLLTSVAEISARTGLTFLPDFHDTDLQTRARLLTATPVALWDANQGAALVTASASPAR